MARKSNKSEKEPSLPSITPQRAIELIKREKEKGEQLLTNRPLSRNEFDAWNSVTLDYLYKAFGDESKNTYGFRNAKNFAVMRGATEAWLEQRRTESLARQLKALDSCVEILETEIELSSDAPPKELVEEPRGNEIFIVHGHNGGARETLARYIEKLGLTATVLHEQPNEGQTIIEKFEKHSANAGFAVVLLTGDDRGGQRDLPYEAQSLRARQNVILELGFFLAKLGRKRVCALYEQGVEIPSDYQGVLFTPLDENGRWKVDIAREMKIAGLPIDMNKAF